MNSFLSIGLHSSSIHILGLHCSPLHSFGLRYIPLDSGLPRNLVSTLLRHRVHVDMRHCHLLGNLLHCHVLVDIFLIVGGIQILAFFTVREGDEGWRRVMVFLLQLVPSVTMTVPLLHGILFLIAVLLLLMILLVGVLLVLMILLFIVAVLTV